MSLLSINVMCVCMCLKYVAGWVGGSPNDRFTGDLLQIKPCRCNGHLQPSWWMMLYFYGCRTCIATEKYICTPPCAKHCFKIKKQTFSISTDFILPCQHEMWKWLLWNYFGTSAHNGTTHWQTSHAKLTIPFYTAIQNLSQINIEINRIHHTGYWFLCG